MPRAAENRCARSDGLQLCFMVPGCLIAGQWHCSAGPHTRRRCRRDSLRCTPSSRPVPSSAPDVPTPQTSKKPQQLPANASFANVPPRVDDYAWLRDDHRNRTAVLSHLQVSHGGSAVASSISAVAASFAATRLRHSAWPGRSWGAAAHPLRAAEPPCLRPFLRRRMRMSRLCWRPASSCRRGCTRKCWAASHTRRPARRSGAGSTGITGVQGHAQQRPVSRLRWPALCCCCCPCCAAHLSIVYQLVPPHALCRCESTPCRCRLPPMRSVHGAGQQYRRFCRRRITHPDAAPSEHDVMDMAQPEEVLLDQDRMAGGCWEVEIAGAGRRRRRPFLGGVGNVMLPTARGGVSTRAGWRVCLSVAVGWCQLLPTQSRQGSSCSCMACLHPHPAPPCRRRPHRHFPRPLPCPAAGSAVCRRAAGAPAVSNSAAAGLVHLPRGACLL